MAVATAASANPPRSLFDCLEEAELTLIEEFNTRVTTYSKGEIVYHEGEKLGRVSTLREGVTILRNQSNTINQAITERALQQVM